MKPSISQYYDKNTQRFLRFAPKGSSSTIHRAIWAPGVQFRTQAVHYVHQLILTHGFDGSDTPIVWDLGCGVGASMGYLAEQLEQLVATFKGVTISSVQHQIATQNIASRSDSTIEVYQGNFCDTPLLEKLEQAGNPSLVYMIESFVHGTCPEQLFKNLAKALRPGGRLIICDDFLAYSEAKTNPLVQRFIQGWHIGTLLTKDQIQQIGETSNLTLKETINLTGYVELNRPRDKAIRLLVFLAQKIGLTSSLLTKPFWQNMFGGDALQQATQKAMIEYRFLVFEKPIE